MSQPPQRNQDDDQEQNASPSASPSPNRATREARAASRLLEARSRQASLGQPMAGARRAGDVALTEHVDPRQRTRPREEEAAEGEQQQQPQVPATPAPPAGRDISAYVPGTNAAVAAAAAAAAPAPTPAAKRPQRVPTRVAEGIARNAAGNERLPDNMPIMGNGRVTQNKTWQITSWADEPIWTAEKEKIARRNGWPIPRIIVFQPEIAPTTGRSHWQGVVAFEERLNAKQVREALQLGTGPTGAWLGITNGDFANVIKYSMKEESRDQDKTKWFSEEQPVHSYGDIPPPNAASGWNSLVLAMKCGKSFEQLAQDHTGDVVRYFNGIQKTLQLLAPPPTQRNVEVFMLFGPTGTGKSHAALTLYPDAFVKPTNKPGEIGWFCGYNSQDVLVIDEFRADWPIADLLKVLDKWPYTAPIKNGNQRAHWT